MISETYSYKLTLEYDGTNYRGWQRQASVPTVEGALRSAFQSLGSTEVHLTAAGRTDAGVHAHGQVVGAHLSKEWKFETLQAALNAHLPSDVATLMVQPAAPTFHARFDAQARTYRYVISMNGPKKAIGRQYAWHVGRQDLDLEAMQAAADLLIGQHDYSAFGSAPRRRGSTERTVYQLTVNQLRPLLFAKVDGDSALDSTVVIEVTANAFLYGMMRSIAGTLVMVGKHKLLPAEVATILHNPIGERTSVPVAPAHGLHQLRVVYPDAESLN